MIKISNKDYQFIYQTLRPILGELQYSAIFITGATGFFGKWVLSFLQYLNQSHDFNVTIFALSRNPQDFLAKFPELTKGVHFVAGDIKDFIFPEHLHGTFKKAQCCYILHMGVAANALLNETQPIEVFENITKGMNHLLTFAHTFKVKKILHISSGAVYADAATLDQKNSCYSEGKRVAEFLGNMASYNGRFEISHARCFTFAGAYLPLDGSYAFGNFLKNCLAKKNIMLNSDGSAIRSYMYMADLVIWLFTLLLRGKNRVSYNVGSDRAISIKDLALEFQKVFPQTQIEFMDAAKNQKKIIAQSASLYVPNIQQEVLELGLKNHFSLEEIITKTKASYE